MLNKRIASEFWIGIVLLVAISVAGAFLLQDPGQNVVDYAEKMTSKQPVKNDTGNEDAIANKSQSLVDEDEAASTCAKHLYVGEQDFRGVYVLSTLPNSVKKEWLFKVTAEDLAKLPPLASKEENFNGSLFVAGATSEMIAKLKKATEAKPEKLTIKRIYLDCSGVPIASLDDNKDAIAKYIK